MTFDELPLDTRLALLRPAHAVPMSDDDGLRLSVFGISTELLILTGRFLTVDGEIRTFEYRLACNGSRTSPATLVRWLGRGWLLDCRLVLNASSGLAGLYWGTVDVIRGSAANGGINATLISGSVASLAPLAYPQSRVRPSVLGPPYVRSINGSNPAAGAEISESVPTGARWRLLGVSAQLVTDGNAANRRPILIIDDGSNVLARYDAAVNEVASSTWNHTWAPVGSVVGDTTQGYVTTPTAPMVLTAGHRIRTSTINIQAGDDWGAPQLLVEEYLEGA